MRLITNLLVFAVIGTCLYIFAPVVGTQIKYSLEKATRVKYVVADEQVNTFEKALIPPNTDFSILIPKIGASAVVIPGVNSTKKTEYVKALARGVAHAKDTAYPDEGGNMFLFAHSQDSFFKAGSYNVVFYLIDELEKGDEIYIFYRNEKIKYIVSDKKVVSSGDTSYFYQNPDEQTLTLQTNSPAGTTFKRLRVFAVKQPTTNEEVQTEF